MSVPRVVLPSHLPLRRVADRLAERSDPTDLRDALDLLLDAPKALCRWLASLSEETDARARVTASSYWHANGFAKLVLHSAPGFRVRMHVWPASQGRRGEADPHSHRWAFASAVLAGDGVAITEYSEADGGVPCTRYGYDGHRLVPDGQVYLRDDVRYSVSTDDRYTTETTTIHTVEPLGDDLVATLVVQGPHTSATTVVYGGSLDGRVNRPARGIDDRDVRRLVADVLAALDPRGDVSR